MAFDFTQIFQKLNEIDVLAKTNWADDESLYNKLILLKPLCDNRLKSIYANLLIQNDIDRLQSYLDKLVKYLQDYDSDNGSYYLDHAIDTIDSIIPIVSKVPFVGENETQSILNKIISDFSQRNNEVIAKITKEKADFSEEIETLKQTISNLSNEIDNKNKEVTTLTSEFQKLFSNAQDKRGKDFMESQVKRDSVFIENEQIRAKNFEVEIDGFTAKANNTLEQIEEIQKKIQDIYGIVGKASIVGTQKVYANNAKIMAHWLQGLSIFLMLIAIGVLFYLFYGQLETITWSKFIYRFSIGGILLLPAFFLSNEAKKQREKENRYRELEIKMATITPYFHEIGGGASKENENLSEKDRIKLELAQKLLSPNDQASDKNAVSSSDILKLFKEFMEIALKK